MSPFGHAILLLMVTLFAFLIEFNQEVQCGGHAGSRFSSSSFESDDGHTQSRGKSGKHKKQHYGMGKHDGHQFGQFGHSADGYVVPVATAMYGGGGKPFNPNKPYNPNKPWKNSWQGQHEYGYGQGYGQPHGYGGEYGGGAYHPSIVPHGGVGSGGNLVHTITHQVLHAIAGGGHGGGHVGAAYPPAGYPVNHGYVPHQQHNYGHLMSVHPGVGHVVADPYYGGGYDPNHYYNNGGGGYVG